MPRKRSVSGRARVRTAENVIRLQTEKINKRIRNLERGGYYGHYKSKELITFVKENPNITLKRGRRSKRHRVVIGNIKTTFAHLALISKKFKQLLRSKGFSTAGIEDIKERSKESLKKTLGGIKGEDATDKDAELFYEIVTYKTDEILQRIPPSEFYALVMDARQYNYDVETWISRLEAWVEINNEYMRAAAERLYNKFVR